MKVFSPVTDQSSFGFPDKEFFVVLASCVRGDVWFVLLFNSNRFCDCLLREFCVGF